MFCFGEGDAICYILLQCCMARTTEVFDKFTNKYYKWADLTILMNWSTWFAQENMVF